MISQGQLWFAFLFFLQWFVPHAAWAGETLPVPPISKYLENHFDGVQFVFSGRVTRVIQSGSFKGPRVWTGNQYYQVDILYSLREVSIDEIFEGGNFIKNKSTMLLADSYVCNNGCPESHIDDDKERRAEERFWIDRGKSAFLLCAPQGIAADYIFDVVLRLRRELRKRGHSYDQVVFQNCRVADSQKPETISAIQNYFSAWEDRVKQARQPE